MIRAPSICRDARVEALGAAARRARRRRGPVIVAASAIGTWFWCPRKAWLDNTMFNSGWLSEQEARVYRDALASLWKAQLIRSKKPAVRRGRRIHGEYVGAELEIFDECSLVEMGARGLLDPREYEEQIERLEKSTDPVEYFRQWEMPLFRYQSDGFEILGVPDDIRKGDEGYIIIELKSTRNPRSFLEGRGLQAALHQLAAYSLAVGSKWRIEKLVLLVVDQTTRSVVAKLEYSPEDMREKHENVLEIARRLASEKPPEPRETSVCKTCEYTAPPARCDTLDGITAYL